MVSSCLSQKTKKKLNWLALGAGQLHNMLALDGLSCRSGGPMGRLIFSTLKYQATILFKERLQWIISPFNPSVNWPYQVAKYCSTRLTY